MSITESKILWAFVIVAMATATYSLSAPQAKPARYQFMAGGVTNVGILRGDSVSGAISECYPAKMEAPKGWNYAAAIHYVCPE